MRAISARTVWALLVCLGCGVAARAAEPDPDAPAPPTPAEAQGATLEPQVTAALQHMSATIKAAPAFTVRVNSLGGYLPNGQHVLLGGTGAIAARKPNRLAATAGSDLGNFTLSYDGTAVTLSSTPTQNVYAASPLTGDLERAVAWVEERLGIEIPVRPLLAADPYAALMGAGSTTGLPWGKVSCATPR